MIVKLVSYTKQTGELEEAGIKSIKDLISYMARVSNPGNQFNSKTSEKLIKYLIANKHWSPLEMIDVTFEIQTTRDIARQMLRHRSFSFQEFSQRYANPQTAFGELFEFSEVRLQDIKNRQGSLSVDDESLKKMWFEMQVSVAKQSLEIYEKAISMGVAKEVARKVLPEGLTKTRMYMKGSIRSWIHYLEVRGPESGTQKEHIEVAKQIAIVLSKVFSLNEDNK